MRDHGVQRNSRNGMLLALPTPLTTVFERPQERVLDWADRDANPFFHFMESLWMLAGRNDVDWISKFSSNIAQFSDDGVIFHGAYGERWRCNFSMDQIRVIAQALGEDHNCRRQVLTMWDPIMDLGNSCKDVPCNTQAYLQVNTSGGLDLMVTNRSNDMIWGAYGANAVHFSMLQEVIASLAGLKVGRYYQVSMNTHVYERHWKLMNLLADRAPDPMAQQRHDDADPYAHGVVRPSDVVLNPDSWFRDLDTFMKGETGGSNPFFSDIAAPLRDAWMIFKNRRDDPNRIRLAVNAAQDCAAGDWRRAAILWLERRR